jgi:hypothetical protein
MTVLKAVCPRGRPRPVGCGGETPTGTARAQPTPTSPKRPASAHLRERAHRLFGLVRTRRAERGLFSSPGLCGRSGLRPGALHHGHRPDRTGGSRHHSGVFSAPGRWRAALTAPKVTAGDRSRPRPVGRARERCVVPAAIARTAAPPCRHSASRRRRSSSASTAGSCASS